MTDILDRVLRPSPDLAESPVAGETVLLHLKDGIYFGLDEVGTKIWESLKSGRSPVDICSSLADEYAIDPERARDDVRAFLADLETRGILTDG